MCSGCTAVIGSKAYAGRELAFAFNNRGLAYYAKRIFDRAVADFPQVILIDEPQSFLHPGAVRKLIEILRQHPQHQFIITTHSPTAVTAADPDVLLLLRVYASMSS